MKTPAEERRSIVSSGTVRRIRVSIAAPCRGGCPGGVRYGLLRLRFGFDPAAFSDGNGMATDAGSPDSTWRSERPRAKEVHGLLSSGTQTSRALYAASRRGPAKR